MLPRCRDGRQLALAVLEAGYSGYPRIGTVPTAIPRLDGLIAADHSGSIVVDIRFGLRGDPAQVRSARRDARRMRVRWAIVWKRTPFVYAYLRQVGFRYDYGVNGVNVYRLNNQPR